MKIVLDTNVLVSGLINPHGCPARLLNLVLTQGIVPVVDSRILAEYRSVLQRPKFSFDAVHLEWLLDYLEQASIIVAPSPLGLNLADPGDEPFLEVAIYAAVSGLVTGNSKHFPKSRSAGIAIYTPEQFLANYFRSKH